MRCSAQASGGLIATGRVINTHNNHVIGINYGSVTVTCWCPATCDVVDPWPTTPTARVAPEPVLGVRTDTDRIVSIPRSLQAERCLRIYFLIISVKSWIWLLTGVPRLNALSVSKCSVFLVILITKYPRLSIYLPFKSCRGGGGSVPYLHLLFFSAYLWDCVLSLDPVTDSTA